MNCTGDIPPGYYHILAYGTDNRTNPAVKKYHYINTTLPLGTSYANSKLFDFYFYFLIHVVEPQLILPMTRSQLVEQLQQRAAVLSAIKPID